MNQPSYGGKLTVEYSCEEPPIVPDDEKPKKFKTVGKNETIVNPTAKPRNVSTGRITF